MGVGWQRLESERDIIEFLFFGGPLACLVSATVGVTVLLLAGIIGPTEFAFSWWSWWIGDTLGVLIFAPLTMVFLFRAVQPWKGRQLSVAGPMLFVLIVMISVFLGLSHWERARQFEQIEAHGKLLASALEGRFAAHQEALSALRRLIEVMPDMTFAQFEHFTQITLKDNGDLFALSFNPYVASADRAAFEHSIAGKSPFREFRISERDSRGQLVRAGVRPEYVPVAYIAPLEGNAPAIGYDIYSEPVRHDAIERAISSGKPAVTAPIWLVQDNKSRVGVLVLHPAYRQAEDRAGQATKPALIGFSVGVIKIDEMIQIAVRDKLPPGLEFHIEDRDVPAEQGSLFRSGTSEALPSGAYLWKTQLSVANRSWEMSVFPTAAFLHQQRSWSAWFAGIAGLLFASVLQILFLATTGRTFTVQRKVDEQTKEIRAQRNVLQALFDEHEALIRRIPVGVFKLRALASGGYSFDDVSPLWCSQTGLDRGQILRDPQLVFDLIPEREREAFFAGLDAGRKAGQPFHWQGSIVKKGEIRRLQIEAVPTALENGDVVWEGIQLDISERKAAEEMQRLLSTAVSQSNASVVITDGHGDIVFVNDAFVVNSGYSREEVMGRNPRILKSGLTGPEVYQSLWETLTRNETWRGELQNRKKTGEIYWEYAAISPVTNEGGEITHYIAIKENITERKRQEEELHQAKEEADAANLAKGRFLATMSHEIRTPMNGIIGLSQLALEKELSPEARRYLERIHLSSHSLLGILNDILDYSKIESGRMALENVPFDLEDLLDRLRNLFSLRAEEKQLDFSVLAEPDVPRLLQGDPLRLQQILSNLVGNAIKFTETGHVLLRVRLAGIENEKARLCCVVEDSGIGMDEDVVRQLFEPFQQADSSISRRFGGTGLGLAISRELLHMMGSDFEVKSAPGSGTRFCFDLLLSLAEGSGTPENGRQKPVHSSPDLTARLEKSGRRLAGKRVLLAEDNAVNQQVVREFLHISGLQVDVARDGREALSILDQATYDAVLMDVHMPVMDGQEATRRMRGQEKLRRLPVIALTAGVTQEERNKCLACGMNDIVAKPVDPEELIRVLLRWIPPEQDRGGQDGSPLGAAGEEASFPEIPGFDFSKLLYMLAGDHRQLIRLLHLFRQDMQGILFEIQSELASGRPGAAKALVHKLKGAAGNVGAQELYRAAKKVDGELQAGEPDPQSLEALNLHFSQAMARIGRLDSAPEREEGATDPAQVNQLVSKIEVFLNSQELVPEDLLDALQTLIPADQREIFRRLRRSIDEIDYRRALELIRTLNTQRI